MKFIDMHCDTLIPFAHRKPYSIYQNEKSVDFIRLRKGGAVAQFFAIFLLPEGGWEKTGVTPMTDLDYIDCLHAGFRRDPAAHSDMKAYAGCYEDLVVNEKAGKMSAFLTIEDGRAGEGNMETCKSFWTWGCA